MTLYHCWIETRIPGATEWQRYERFQEEADPPGVYVADEGMCDGVDDLAQRVLGNYLKSVLRAYTDQADVHVRTCAQVCSEASVGPSAVCQASLDDITEARETLRQLALTNTLRSACHGVFDAHHSLEVAVVKAHAGGLALGTITHAVAAHLDAQAVACLIDAPRAAP
ncbi:hypothetical protein [Streptomyces chartreusis]